MVFAPDELSVPAFAVRARRLLERAVAELDLEWIAIAELGAPDGHVAMHWRIAVPRAPDAPPSPEDLARWLEPATQAEPRAIPLCVLPRIGADADAVLVMFGRGQPAPADIAALTQCLERGLSEDRRARLSTWILDAVEQAGDPIELTDRDARIIYVNEAWRRTFEFPASSYLGRTPKQLFRDAPDPAVDRAFYQFALAAISDGELWLGMLASRNRSGQTVLCEVSVTAAASSASGFLGHLAVRRRLDHRAAREAALMAAHREFREILAALPDGVVVLRDELIYFVNAAFLAIVDREEATVIRGSPTAFVHPEDHAAIGSAAADARPVRFLRPDGSARLVDVAIAGAVSFEGAPATILLLRDNTDRRLAEERMAEREKLAALGLLAAGVAHEINNPLSYVAANLELIARGDPSAGPLDVLVREAVDGVRRIRTIVDDLRGFSAVDRPGAPEPVDVGKAIASAINLTANEIRHRARLVRRETPGLFVSAHEGPVVQVLVAILTNAAQAIPEGASASHHIEVSSRVQGDWIEIAIADTGVGVAAELVSRLFEPFVTTKSRGKGTGLGLAISRRIIQEFGGTIAIRPQLERGTEVVITLPRAATAIPEPIVARRAITSGRRGRVLVIDDDEMVASVVARILRAHDVVTTTDGADALAMLQREEFDVILCDLMMPDIPGPTLYQQALALRPELAARFLFMSGGAFTESANAFVESLTTPVVFKPFDSDDLRERVMALVMRSEPESP